MKKTLIAFSLILSFLALPMVAAGAEWYKGGTLHDATIAQWKTAKDADKLATAADWAISRPAIKARVERSGGMDALKPLATDLVKCIDEKVGTIADQTTKASKVGTVCMIILKW